MQSSILLYQTADADITVEATYQDESFWLTQKAMAKLFGVETSAINKHLTNIYKSKEIAKSSTISILETVQKEGNWDSDELSDLYKVINKIN